MLQQPSLFDNCRDPCIGTCGNNANCEVRTIDPSVPVQKQVHRRSLAGCDRRMVVEVAKRLGPDRNPGTTIVIGQQYSESRDPPTSRSVLAGVQSCRQEPQQRHVVGSRSSGGGSGSCGSACQGRSAPSLEIVVVGAGSGRRKRFRPPLGSVFQLTKFQIDWT